MSDDERWLGCLLSGMHNLLGGKARQPIRKRAIISAGMRLINFPYSRIFADVSVANWSSS